MRVCLFVLSFLGLFLPVQAHVVPNMTIEAEFARDHSFVLRLNLDPRVFLSDQPTSLPPVTADWFLNQSEEQKKATYQQATEYLKANVGLIFSDQSLALPEAEFVAMDGATNEPVKLDTAETHLLATAKGQVPAGSDNFKLAFGKAANVSLILLNSEEGNEERRPQVIFPGETSRPFKITPMPLSEAEEGKFQVTEVKVQKGMSIGVLFVPASLFAAACAFVVIWLAVVAFLMRPKHR